MRYTGIDPYGNRVELNREATERNNWVWILTVAWKDKPTEEQFTNPDKALAALASKFRFD